MHLAFGQIGWTCCAYEVDAMFPYITSYTIYILYKKSLTSSTVTDKGFNKIWTPNSLDLKSKTIATTKVYLSNIS